MSSVIVSQQAAIFAAVVRDTLDREQVQTHGLQPYEVDGVVPEVVVEPATLWQVERVLIEAQRDGVAVIAVGGATQLGLGNLPQAYTVALSLRRLNALLAYEPADMTVTVQAGIPLSDLQQRLAARGQWLPVDAPVAAEATIGGVVATNSYGPARHGYGTIRDWLIGMRVVHPDGTSSKSGGRVVKNVTGYDMHKLHVGALGTLGVIVEATFKLAPVPRTECTVRIACESAPDAYAVSRAAHDEALALQALEMISPSVSQVMFGDRRWCVLARAAGSAAAVERTLRDLRRIANDASSVAAESPADSWSVWASAFACAGLAGRISVPVEHIAEVCVAVELALSEQPTRMAATVSCGLVRVLTEPPDDRRALEVVAHLRDIASRCGGTLVIDEAPLAVKQQTDVFGPIRSDFAIMRRLKEQFDPQRTLSPGRFIGGL